jgi:hypothetical protein
MFEKTRRERWIVGLVYFINLAKIRVRFEFVGFKGKK